MTYLEILGKIQTQTLDNVKQVEAVQISTLQTVREVAASLPSLMKLPNGPTIEGLPTLAQVVEPEIVKGSGASSFGKAVAVEGLQDIESDARRSGFRNLSRDSRTNAHAILF